MEKVINYINEENLKVDIRIFDYDSEAKFRDNCKYQYIENSKPDNYTLDGYIAEENGKFYLFRSWEEFKYDVVPAMITF